ncbi:hypothetical protein P148_SR1C00001G0498 [candidate division SR1 bacterium RAAC1_SR1_1]|nr:hypothetical protein P148_SR1C00001G0498 [candidate division SR1 bacterium RAAC1_SR1_1]
MKNQYFDIVVKKIGKYKNKLLEIEKIKDIIKNILDSEYSEQKTYKMIYYLKNRGYIESLKKDIFFIKSPEKTYQEQELVGKFYREILKKHCNEYLQGKRYIGGLKALELNISSFEIPEEILIVNMKKQATEVIIGQKKGLFKTYGSNQKNLFPLFYKYTKKIPINNQLYPVANLELSIIETLYNQSIINKGYGEELIKKIIRKLGKSINIKVLEEFLKHNKHHSAINKLYKVSQTINPTLADELKTIIKKYSYFI